MALKRHLLIVLSSLILLAPCFAGQQPAPLPGNSNAILPTATADTILAEALAAPHGEESLVANVVYHGNIKSHKFHRPGCRYYNCKACTRIFTSKAQALQAGYLPCGVCRP
ncbi:MAG: hypothetical protein MI747_22585 [Desulfobacterales bacterium]|nr:hypothetical protein [Desulfobacterales bacterium]